MAVTKKLSLLLPPFSVCPLLIASRTCHLALLCPCSGVHQTGRCLNSLPQQKTIHIFVHVFLHWTSKLKPVCSMARCVCSSAGTTTETMGICSCKWGQGDVEGGYSSFCCSLEMLPCSVWYHVTAVRCPRTKRVSASVGRKWAERRRFTYKERDNGFDFFPAHNSVPVLNSIW